MFSEDTYVAPDSDVIESSIRGIVLIIDDEPDHAEAIAFGLSSQGYDPIIVSTASTGLMAVNLYDPALVLLDIRLPDGDGLELCSRLNDDSHTCEIPVILLSGIDHPEIVRRARSAGCDYFVRKPCDPNALLTLINDAISRAKSWD